MKTALLVCDHILPDLVEIDGDYPDMYESLLPGLKMDTYWVCDGHLPTSAKDFDAFVCTGSSYSVYDDEDWIQQLITFVSEVYTEGKKFIGICFGHQIMAKALGGEVRKAAGGWSIGVHQFTSHQHGSWMNPNLDRFNLLMMCQDQVCELPPHARVWASTDNCPIGMFTVGNHFLGIQAHPEFSKTYNQALFTSRSEKIDEQVIKAAIESMNEPINDRGVARWIQNFIRF